MAAVTLVGRLDSPGSNRRPEIKYNNIILKESYESFPDNQSLNRMRALLNLTDITPFLESFLHKVKKGKFVKL